MLTRPSVLMCALALLLPTLVDAQQVEPGDQWEVTQQMQMPGMGMSMPARTQKLCAPKNSDKPAGIPEPEDSDCETYDVQQRGTTTTFKMRCTGKNAMTGAGEMTYQGRDSYKGQMTMTMDGETMTMKMAGKRTGDCDAGKLKRDVAAAQAQGDKMQAQQCAEAARNMQIMMFDGSYPVACDPKHKAELCKRYGTEEGYDLLAVRDKSPLTGKADLETAAGLCGIPAEANRKKLCGNAMKANSLVFAARHCPGEAAPVAQRECAGRTFTAPPAEKYREFCSAYARHGLMQGEGATGAAASGGSSGNAGSGKDADDAAAEEGKESTIPPPQDNAIEQGKKALRKILPF